MGYFHVRYNSRVVNYDRRGFIGLATGLQFDQCVYYVAPKTTYFLQMLLANLAAYFCLFRSIRRRFQRGLNNDRRS